MRIRTLPTLTALCLSAAVAAQHGRPVDASERTSDKTIVQLAIESGQFKTLVAAVKAAGLADTLSGKGPFTLFAPTDEAFAKLGKETIADLLKPENKAKLTSVLTYHVVGGLLPAEKVLAQTSLQTLQGSAVAIASDKKGATVAGARIVKTDIMGSNGVIHVIDSVILPPAADDIVATAKKAGAFGTLLKAAVAAGLADTLAKDGPFTVFAPTDEAFAQLDQATLAGLLQPENKDQLAAILKYHVVSGKVMAEQASKLDEAKTLQGGALPLKVMDGKLHVGSATVVQADVVASNGVIHVIDSVLLPPQK
jgi:uncharacterized surface protein with fasciclin (FAS1) repeats